MSTRYEIWAAGQRGWHLLSREDDEQSARDKAARPGTGAYDLTDHRWLVEPNQATPATRALDRALHGNAYETRSGTRLDPTRFLSNPPTTILGETNP
jgi:hypothetical protein